MGRWQSVVWGVFGLFLAMMVSWLPGKAAYSQTDPLIGNDLQACVQGLEQRQILEVSQLTNAEGTAPISQADFAQAVLRTFPGRFVAANQALGLTFEGQTEVAALLEVALDDHGVPGAGVVRSQALTLLSTGAALPPRVDASQLLQTNFPDSQRIPSYTREGIAAALVQDWVANPIQPQKLEPNRLTTVADAAAFLCLANPELVVTVPPEIVTPWVMPTPVAAPTKELRGVWLTNIDSDVLFSRERLEPALQTLATLNFNTVYPTVWNWGYTLFPSTVAQRTLGDAQGLYPDLDNTGHRNQALEAAQGDRDMLQELLEIAHPLGLKVMPWFEFGFMAPANSALAHRHPDWLTQKRDGTTITLEGDDERVWLNPFHPEVQRFMLYLINELMANYDVDGFQVDDHMGLPVAYGYDPYTISLYQQEHHGNRPPTNPQDPEWKRWRADKITTFMGQVFAVVKARRPQAVMSVSPNPHPFAYDYFLQDWPTWIQKGYVEELIIQLYRNDLGRFVWEMNRTAAQAARQKIPTAIGVLSGLRGRPIPMGQIQAQVEAVRDRNFSGISFFFYESLWWSESETLEQRQDSLLSLFPNIADRP